MNGALLAVDLLALAAALWVAPWRVLLRERRLQHLWLGGTVLLVMVWQMHAGLSPGLGVHFLGVTAATLVFGWDLALIMATLALLMMRLTGLEGWQDLGVAAATEVLLPVAVSALGARWVERRLPGQAFLFLLLAVFAGAMLALAAAQLSNGGWLWWSGRYPLTQIVREQWVFLPVLIWVEGLLNGIIVAGLLVQAPQLIRGFDHRRYVGR